MGSPAFGRATFPGSPEISLRLQRLVAIDQPVEPAGLDVHQQAMYGNVRADERAVAHEVHGLDDVGRSLAKVPKNSLMFGQGLPVHAHRAQALDQLYRGGLAHLAIGVADDRDFLPPLIAQASASERMVLLSGPVMMLPALRSQMNCSAGIKLAYDTAKKAFIPKGSNRVILATDGDFNVGASSTESSCG